MQIWLMFTAKCSSIDGQLHAAQQAAAGRLQVQPAAPAEPLSHLL